MMKSYLILPTTIILITINIQQTHAHLTEQCTLWIPVYTKPIVKGNLNDLPIHITAKDVTGQYPHFIKYKGSVNIQQDNQTITADEVKLTQTEIRNQKSLRTVVATRNIHYDDPKIILKGSKAWSNLNNKDIDVENSEYLMVDVKIAAIANKIKLRGKNRYTILEKGMFTTCLPGNDSWKIVGLEVILDHKEQVAEIWNAHIRIANVPIFYNPYLQLPIGNKHRSGFLLPNNSYTKSSSLNFALLFYWNIAPN